MIYAFAFQIYSDFSGYTDMALGSAEILAGLSFADVDLLVVMPHRGHPIHKAVEILDQLDPKFAIDLLVRSPAEVRRRLTQQDWFMRAVVEKGKVLYEAADA